MADRRRQIELLIGSRFDLLWFPGGALRTSGGLAPGEKRPCPDCGHGDQPGWRIDKFKKRAPCATCGGRTEPREHGPWQGRDRGRGFVFVDSMDTHRVPVGDAETKASARPRKTVMCDACAGEGATTHGRCERCFGTGRRDQHVFDLQLDTSGERSGADAIDVAIDRRDDAGSYHDLDVALAALSRHANKPLQFYVVTINATHARRLLDEMYLHHTRELHELTTFEQSLLELALAYIDLRMPDPIRVPPGVARNDRERRDHLKAARGRGADPAALKQRDQQIQAWARACKPYPWICAQVDLSDRQVREIINGREHVA